MLTPSRIKPVSSRAEAAEPVMPEAVPVKNIALRVISRGKRPLHGTRLLVSIAISRSRGESTIRQPTTPAALQPKPIHIVCVYLYIILKQYQHCHHRRLFFQ